MEFLLKTLNSACQITNIRDISGKYIKKIMQFDLLNFYSK